MFDVFTTGDAAHIDTIFMFLNLNSIKVGPMVFLLQMFVITENIMKRPVFYRSFCCKWKPPMILGHCSSWDQVNVLRPLLIILASMREIFQVKCEVA